MITRSLARTVVGIVGNVLSLFLFLSPAPTFAKICKAKSVQQFKPDPYVATLLNCAMWVFYGMPFVHPDSLLVVTINGIGFVIELVYIAIFLLFSDWPKRRKIIIILIIEAIFMAVVVVITLFLFEGTKIRSMFVGILCVIFNVIMYTAPLTVMRSVIKTKSVRYMPFYLSLASFANGICWLAYALIIFDPYVTVPNGLGAISGAVQLILYAIYYKSTSWNEEETPSEVQVTEQA